MEQTRSTTVISRELGVHANTLRYAILTGRMPRPSMNDSGDYRWTDEDVANAREAMKPENDRRRRRLVEATT